MHDSVIREFRPADLAAVVEVFERSVRETACRDYRPAQIAAWIPDPARWPERLAGGSVYLLESQGKTAGFMRLAGGVLDLLYVHPEFQRRGFGRALIELAASQASAAGWPRLVAEVSLTARPCFERCGFRVVAAREVECRGVRLRNFRMARAL